PPSARPFAWPLPRPAEKDGANGTAGKGDNHSRLAEGWLQPVLGPELTLCAAAHGGDRYFTSRESAMSDYVGRIGPGVTLPVDLTVFVDWDRFLPIYQSLLIRAAELELLPRSSPEDVEKIYQPYIAFLRNLGRLHLEGAAQNSRTLLNGFLAE